MIGRRRIHLYRALGIVAIFAISNGLPCARAQSVSVRSWVRSAILTSRELADDNAFENPDHQVALDILTQQFWDRFQHVPMHYAAALTQLSNAAIQHPALGRSYFYQGLWMQLQTEWFRRRPSLQNASANQAVHHENIGAALMLVYGGSRFLPQLRLARGVVVGLYVGLATPEEPNELRPPLVYLNPRLAEIDLDPPRWLLIDETGLGNSLSAIGGGAITQSAVRVAAGTTVATGPLGWILSGFGMFVGEATYHSYRTSQAYARTQEMFRASSHALTQPGADPYSIRLHSERLKLLMGLLRMHASDRGQLAFPHNRELILHDWLIRQEVQTVRIGGTRTESTAAIEWHWKRVFGQDSPTDWTAILTEQELQWAERWAPSNEAEFDPRAWAWKQIWLSAWLLHTASPYSQQVGSEMFGQIDAIIQELVEGLAR